MKSPIEKAIDANTAAIKELTQVLKVRSKEISWAVTGISESLKNTTMTKEDLQLYLIGGSDNRKHRKTDSDQDDGNRGESDR